jgi:hypothetical protein
MDTTEYRIVDDGRTIGICEMCFNEEQGTWATFPIEMEGDVEELKAMVEGCRIALTKPVLYWKEGPNGTDLYEER